MKRTPEPHGTRAAAARHERLNEPLCDACREAKNEYAKSLRAAKKPAREITRNREWRDMDAALEANPPVIQWEKNRRGVMVAVSIYDPHKDSGHNGTKDACKRNHLFTEANTIWDRGWRLCRTCKNEARRVTAPVCTDESLLAAARTEI